MGMRFQNFKVIREKDIDIGLPGLDFTGEESIENIYDEYQMKIYSFSGGLNRLVGASGSDWGGEIKGYGTISDKLKVGDLMTHIDESGNSFKFKISSFPITGISYTVFKLTVVSN